MGKDINLTSQEWSDLIFEGKNKAYGAYEMRQSTSKRHIIAFLVVLLFVIFVAFLPMLVATVKSSIARPSEGITTSTTLADLTPKEAEVKEQDIIRQENAPPPPPLKSTIKFTAPVITDADKVTDDDEMKSQSELQSNKLQISVADVKGTDDVHGVDIQDLQEHKVIAEVKEEEIFVGVEQQPQFPGGEQEMMNFIQSNLKYPVIAQENGVEGKVIIRFVVNKDGNVEKVEVLRSLDASCDKEAIRVVKMMPKWIPGKQNGRSVNVYYTLPVTYKLQK